VTAGPGGRELSVEGTLAPGSPEELSVDDGAEPFVRDLEIDDGGGFAPVALRGTSWFAPGCTARGCKVRYRFALAEASARIDDVDRGMAMGETFLAPPSTWLVRPMSPTTRAPFRLRVTTPPGVHFVTGLARAADGTYVADVNDVAEAPYSGFGAFRLHTIAAATSTVEVAIAPGDYGRDDAGIVRWITEATRDVVAFYGRFPLDRALVVVTPSEGHGSMGKTLGNGGGSIVMSLGRASTDAELDDDWVMTHELVHLALPNLPRENGWLEEGLSTYVEPVARARRGRLAPERVWADFVQGMPQGQPVGGDKGLDRTPTWGRTYWGGALFCLLADVEIRKQTGGQRSLDDALKAILAHGGNIAVRWSLEEVLRVGDEATGTRVLTELHERHGGRAEKVDLEALFRELGVKGRGPRSTFDDRAPLAPIRASITRTIR
jgi:predicted metalloprotease with PDZ domain